MDETLFAGITLDTCGQCKGLWFDEGEVRLCVERYKKGMGGGDKIVAAELQKGLGQKGGGGGLLGGFLDFLRQATGKK